MSRALCLLTLVLAMTPAAVQANISAPWSPGDAVSEPWGALREVEILGETLELDLRPLAKGGDVAVTAHYRVRSPRLDRKLDLVFVTPGIIRGTVSLDGADLAGVGEEVSDLPKQWKDDLVTPDVDGGELRLEVNRSQRLIRFGAALSAGKIHELKVHFTMLPGRYDPTHSLNATHQVGYLLAPARQWGRFGGLKVKALLPAGWEAAASPALVRQGDTLEGSFKGIPSDLLAISARKPAMLSWGWILVLLGVLAGLHFSVKLVVFAGRRTAALSTFKVSLLGLGLGSVAAVLPFAFGLAGQQLWSALLDPVQLSSRYFYGYSMGLFLLGPVVAGVLVVVMVIVFFVARRRAGGCGGPPLRSFS